MRKSPSLALLEGFGYIETPEHFETRDFRCVQSDTLTDWSRNRYLHGSLESWAATRFTKAVPSMICGATDHGYNDTFHGCRRYGVLNHLERIS